MSPRAVVSAITLAALLSLAPPAVAEPRGVQPGSPAALQHQGLFGRPVIRDAFHFQVAFGLGGGPDTAGVFHAMEVGGTFKNGWTLALLHTFIQNKDVFAPNDGPDLIGGWMAELKVPLLWPELVAKVATGLGGTHDQSDGIKAFVGWGAAYGLDLHLPLFARSGLTLVTTGFNILVQGQHHFGAAAGLGYTFF